MKAFTFKRILKGLLLAFLALVTLFTTAITNVAYADDGANIEKTDPLADLRQDENFNINDYPVNERGKFELYSLTEYCYPFYPEDKDKFALYVYVYNPATHVFKDSILNRIQMAVGYDDNGKPNDYKKYNLKLVSCSKGDGYSWLFYKFKVVDDGSIYDRLTSAERRYDVSGLELITDYSYNATESNVSKTFIYSGFAKGYGSNPSAESTLKCETETLETVELNVNSTYWRSKTSNLGAGYQTQLDSVYFSVPNRLLEEYGKLQRIKAVWYEYQTKDIVVTSDSTTYNAVKPYIGKSDLSTLYYGFLENPQKILKSDYDILHMADWSFNPSYVYKEDHVPEIDKLYYLFPTANWCDIDAYDPYGDITTTGGVTGNELYDYIKNYSKNSSSNTLTIKDGKISADLFESDIPDSRKIDNEFGKIGYGYSFYDFDADVDILDWQAYKPGDHSFDENVKVYNFWKTLFGKFNKVDVGVDVENVTPILMLNDNCLTGTKTEISDRLFINYNDVDKIKLAHETAKKNDETLVLFRFATSDYYSSEIVICDDSGLKNKEIKDKAYRAKQSVFLDFDIIQLTFNKEGEMTVIPVVASPIDIVNDITSPSIVSGAKWWETLLAYLITILASILGLVVLAGAFKLLVTIWSGNLHWVGKLLLTLPILAVLALIAIYALPWVINVVKGFGGL